MDKNKKKSAKISKTAKASSKKPASAKKAPRKTTKASSKKASTTGKKRGRPPKVKLLTEEGGKPKSVVVSKGTKPAPKKESLQKSLTR